MAIDTSDGARQGHLDLDLVIEIGCRIAAVTHEPRPVSFLGQHISMSVWSVMLTRQQPPRLKTRPRHCNTKQDQGKTRTKMQTQIIVTHVFPLT